MPSLHERSYSDFVQLTILRSSNDSCDDIVIANANKKDDKVTLSNWKKQSGAKATDRRNDDRQLTNIARFSYGVGHVLNDLCASMWFTHFLVFYQKVVLLSSVEAGALLLIGQIVDGLATPIVGTESDQTRYYSYGKRKVWHLAGTVAVALSFPFIFNLCITCENASHWPLFVYYVPFIIIFQVGWAAVQISHLALIPEIAATTGDKVTLNATR